MDNINNMVVKSHYAAILHFDADKLWCIRSHASPMRGNSAWKLATHRFPMSGSSTGFIRIGWTAGSLSPFETWV